MSDRFKRRWWSGLDEPRASSAIMNVADLYVMAASRQPIAGFDTRPSSTRGNMAYWIHSAPEDMEFGDEQRPCARGERCTSRDVNGDPALGPRAFCDADRDHISRCLGWLPSGYLELYLRLGDKGGGGHDRVSGTPSQSVPPNLAFDSLMGEIVNVLASWDERVRTVAGLCEIGTEASRRQRDGVALTSIVQTLSGHLDVLLGLSAESMVRVVPIERAADLPSGTPGVVRPAAGYAEVVIDLSGADAGMEIITLHRRARHLLGLTPRHEDLPVPCWNPECGLRTVRRFDGAAGLSDSAECTSCGTEYTHERYRLLMAEVAERRRSKNRRDAG